MSSRSGTGFGERLRVGCKVLMAEQLSPALHGGVAEGDKLQAPPVVAEGAATWAEVDAMIGKLKIEWHRRMAVLSAPLQGAGWPLPG